MTPDMERVIKGLAHCTRPSEVGKGGNFCMDCPYTEPIGFNQFKCNSQQMMKDALALLKEQPEIVRCKDCEYHDDVTDECADIGSPCYRNGWCEPDWFCADGKRRDDDARETTV